MVQRPPRVAVVCDYALDYVGGAQTALVEQVAALRAAGCAVVVISPSSTGAGATPFTGDVVHLRVPARWVLPGVDLPVVRNSGRLRRSLDRVFTAHRIDVVQLHSEFGMAAAAIAVARGRGIPVAHTVHTFFWQTTARPQALIAAAVRGFHGAITGIAPTRVALADKPADSALRNMTLAVAQLADVVVSPSAHQAERLREAGLTDVVVVPNTVTTTSTGGQVLDRVGEPLRIVWIGRCEPEKRILQFVRAVVAAQHELGPGRLRAVVVGDGSQLAAARRIATEAAGAAGSGGAGSPGGLDRRVGAGEAGGAAVGGTSGADGPGSMAGGGEIAFLGRQEHDRIPQILAGADLAALTSHGFDNQPMTIVEAVTAGRGVLYCDPALSEGLEGPGIRVPTDDVGMAAALAAVARDPERVVAASRETVRAREDFAPATHARRMLECYERAAERVCAVQCSAGG